MAGGVDGVRQAHPTGSFLSRVREFQHMGRPFLMAPGHRLRNAGLSLDAVCLSPPRSYKASVGALHNMRSSAAAHMRAPGGGEALDLGEVAQGVFAAARVAQETGTFDSLMCSALAGTDLDALTSPFSPLCARAGVFLSVGNGPSNARELVRDVVTQHSSFALASERPAGASVEAKHPSGVVLRLPVRTHYVLAECHQGPNAAELETYGASAQAVGSAAKDGFPVQPTLCQLRHGGQFAEATSARRMLLLPRGGDADDSSVPALVRSELFANLVMRDVAVFEAQARARCNSVEHDAWDGAAAPVPNSAWESLSQWQTSGQRPATAWCAGFQTLEEAKTAAARHAYVVEVILLQARDTCFCKGCICTEDGGGEDGGSAVVPSATCVCGAKLTCDCSDCDARRRQDWAQAYGSTVGLPEEPMAPLPPDVRREVDAGFPSVWSQPGAEQDGAVGPDEGFYLGRDCNDMGTPAHLPFMAPPWMLTLVVLRLHELFHRSAEGGIGAPATWLCHGAAAAAMVHHVSPPLSGNRPEETKQMLSEDSASAAWISIQSIHTYPHVRLALLMTRSQTCGWSILVDAHPSASRGVSLAEASSLCKYAIFRGDGMTRAAVIVDSYLRAIFGHLLDWEGGGGDQVCGTTLPHSIRLTRRLAASLCCLRFHVSRQQYDLPPFVDGRIRTLVQPLQDARGVGAGRETVGAGSSGVQDTRRYHNLLMLLDLETTRAGFAGLQRLLWALTRARPGRQPVQSDGSDAAANNGGAAGRVIRYKYWLLVDRPVARAGGAMYPAHIAGAGLDVSGPAFDDRFGSEPWLKLGARGPRSSVNAGNCVHAIQGEIAARLYVFNTTVNSSGRLPDAISDTDRLYDDRIYDTGGIHLGARFGRFSHLQVPSEEATAAVRKAVRRQEEDDEEQRLRRGDEIAAQSRQAWHDNFGGVDNSTPDF